MTHEFSGSNYEQECERHIDLSTREWTERLAHAPIYKKTAIVHIRPAAPGELVITTLAGKEGDETRNIAGIGTVVITNPSGEKQVVGLEKAVQRYDLTDTPGLFLAKGMVRAIDNPLGSSISILAPWGSPQYGSLECKIAALYDPSEPNDISTDRYLIGKEEFIETYGNQKVDSKGIPVPPAPSALVLQAMEQYDSHTEGYAHNARPYLGMMGLYFANLDWR